MTFYFNTIKRKGNESNLNLFNRFLISLVDKVSQNLSYFDTVPYLIDFVRILKLLTDEELELIDHKATIDIYIFYIVWLPEKANLFEEVFKRNQKLKYLYAKAML
jgi:hypothetical protein